MAKHLGNQLDERLLTHLDQGRLFRTGGLALPLLTVDEAGWPHVAMAAGAVATRPNEVWVAMGGKTGSLQNLERTGQVTLLVAGPELLYYVKGRAEVARRQMRAIPQEAALRVDVTEVLSDTEPFLTMTSGISYRYSFMHEDYTNVMGALLDELQALAEES